MAANSRTHKIEIKSKTITIDDNGASEETLESVGSFWSAIEHKNATEKWANGRINPDVTDLFTIGYVAGIDRKMTLFYGGNRYEILGVEDVREEHQVLIIQAKEEIL